VNNQLRQQKTAKSVKNKASKDRKRSVSRFDNINNISNSQRERERERDRRERERRERERDRKEREIEKRER
jgi:ATP-dependent RNA helicase DDX46/PRP5